MKKRGTGIRDQASVNQSVDSSQLTVDSNQKPSTINHQQIATTNHQRILGYRLPATGYWLLAIGYWLCLFTGCSRQSKPWSYAAAAAVIACVLGCGGGGGGDGGSGNIVVTSVPDGASVFLNGEDKGTAPLTISALPVGTYTVKATKTGYKDKESSVSVAKDQTTTVDVTLELAVGTLVVSSYPPKAAVFLDGVSKGETGLTITSVSEGTHTVKVTKTGFKDNESSVTIERDKTKTLSVNLELGVSVPSNNNGNF